MNPSLNEPTIRRYLSVLQQVDVVKEHVLKSGDRVRGFPYKFYTITKEARELFDAKNLFPETTWTRQYQRVEKTPEIQDIEAMPRPTE